MRDFLSRMTLGRRFALGIGAMFLPLLIVIVIAAGIIRPAVMGTVDEVVRNWPPHSVAIEDLEKRLLRTVVSINQHHTTKTTMPQKSLAKSRELLDGNFSFLIARAAERSQEQNLLLVARKDWEQGWSLAMATLQTAVSERSSDGGEGLVKANHHFLDAVDRLEVLQNFYAEAAYQRLLQVGERGAQGPRLLIGAFAFALLLAAVAGFVLARSILRPVAALHEGAKRIREGDLSSRVTIDSGDELGQLAQTFNNMAQELNKSQRELLDQSLQDELTRVKNYRGFLHRLNDELNRWFRYGDSFSLLLLDLDHFKTVNDTYGHPAGDEALRRAADTLRLSLRDNDCVARYGGEEFAVVLPQTDAEGAVAIAERMREAIAAIKVDASGSTFGISASIGVSSVSDECCTEERLVSEADRALYQAKQMGRNRVCRM